MRIPSEGELIEMEGRFRELADNAEALNDEADGMSRNDINDLAAEMYEVSQQVRADYALLLELVRAQRAVPR